MKNDVPSIGSMIHTRSDWPWAPSSSPTTASPGRAAVSSSTISRSTAVSARVTGLPSAFDVTAVPATVADAMRHRPGSAKGFR
jgi:hypothetical protein